MQSLIILGRQPALGVAEIESLYGADKITPIGNQAVALDVPHTDIDFMRLGGMVKFCKILTILDTTNWGDIQKFLVQAVPAHAANLPEGKLQLGLSVYGLSVNAKRIVATGLSIKKLLKQNGRSVRLVPNNEPELNAAQVLHNGLTRKLGWELVFVKYGHRTVVAQSIAVQDIEAYSARDQNRPARDAKVGMLPPKLAQIVINLAVGHTNRPGKFQTINQQPQTTVLDPFCGTGVLLQEALLMGYHAIGTDLEPRMVEYSEKNLVWLAGVRNLESPVFRLETADATDQKWFTPSSPLSESTSVIAAETYLGRPFSSTPDTKTLQKVIQAVDTIHKKFLQNVARQTTSGFRMCIAVPAWSIPSPNSHLQTPKFRHLPTLDKLDELGYTRMSFVHVSNEDLIYHRENQIVARELVVLTRK